MNRETIGAIDIGSNAIRLLINYIEEDKGTIDFKKAAFVRVPIRLGEDVFTQGKIGESKKKKLAEAMQAFAQLMETFNVKVYRACATSAMREAQNGQEVTDFVRKCSGINIEIIDGKEEADTIFTAGGLSSVMDTNKSYLYVDVGGGSTEIVIYSNQTKICSQSFPLGTVRIINDAVEAGESSQFKEWLESVALPYSPVAIIGSGGNINKVHKLLGKKEKETLRYVEVKLLYDELRDMSYEERVKVFKLNRYRADVILPAMKLFLTVGKICKINEIVVPRVGLADGIIYQLYNDQRTDAQ